jgi:hypothetical protein
MTPHIFFWFVPKMQTVVNQVRSQATEALQQARTAADPHLAKAQELASQQAKNLSKVLLVFVTHFVQ